MVKGGPKVRFGHGLAKGLGEKLPPAIIATMDEPWSWVGDYWGGTPRHVIYVESMDEKALAEAERSLPQAPLVVGIGGGSAIDTAKYIAWRRGIDLILVPTIASADACVTSSVAVRVEGKVRYVGRTVPKEVIADLSLIEAAPPRLNRAGVGDILSIHTALYDWKLAADRCGERYEEGVASRAQALVEALERNSEEIREVTERGVRTLIELFGGENDLCEEWGNSRPEEGSEHFFAYNVEFVTDKHFIHGEVVGLGIYIMSYLQENRFDWVKRLLAKTGLSYRPEEIGLEEGELREVLLTLPRYVAMEGLPYSIANALEFDEPLIKKVLGHLKGGIS